MTAMKTPDGLPDFINEAWDCVAEFETRAARIASEGAPELATWLKMMVSLEPRRPELRFDSPTVLLLELGRVFPMKPCPAGLTGDLRRCFDNARACVLADPDRFVYVEGTATTGLIPVRHAWVVDLEDGAAFDPTWPMAEWAVSRGAVFEHVGVPIAADPMIEALQGSGEVLDDWLRDWPLLRSDPAEWMHPAFSGSGT